MELKMERVVPVKSFNDPKDYLALVLENGLKLLLASDPECDKVAVSLSVGVGSMNDPEELPGLAHLCEHLLSVESSSNQTGNKPFNAFIAEHGGMFNAFTSRDQTNFHFDVDPTVFQDALQRFVKFFISPVTLTEAHISKEVVTVDSEHLSKIGRDGWRKMGVEAATAKQTHPYHKFTTGNKESLMETPKRKDINVLKAASDFRSKYYVPNIMCAVVYGNLPINTLETICPPLFCKIPAGERIKLPHWEEWHLGENELRKRIDIIPIADIKDFYIVFPVENPRAVYKTFPHGYITKLLANRGPGSLYAYLCEEKHWVEYSYMNTAIPARGFGELSIGFQLTKTGLEHIDEIILHTFQYIKMLKDSGPQLYFWTENQQILGLQFNHQDKEIPVEFAQRIANLLHVYPLKDVLGIGSLLTEFSPEIIQRFMNYLHPDNCRVITVCKKNEEMHKNFLEDRWYGAKYAVTEFTSEQLEAWKECKPLSFFHLPPENKFIPTDFRILNQNNKVKSYLSLSPTLLLDTGLTKAWFLPDNYFHLPKGVIRLEIFTPLPMSDPLSYNMNHICFLTLKNILNEEFHQASVTGLYHGIKPTFHGVEITVTGFSHKLILLMQEVFIRIMNCLEDPSVWKLFRGFLPSVKERHQNGLLNSQNLPLQTLITYYLSLLLREKRFCNEELVEAMSDVNEESLLNYIKLFFFRAHFEWFAYGNFKKEEVLNLISVCMEHLKQKWNTRALLPSQICRMREVSIKKGCRFVFHKTTSTQPGTSCCVLIQAGVLTRRKNVILEIVDQIIFEPLFTQLRSQERIGYIVRSSVRKSNGCHALQIFVQGDTAITSPSYICDRILCCLNDIEKHLIGMDQMEFNQHKNAVRLRKKEQPKTMHLLFNKIWDTEIYPKRYEFDGLANELDFLNEIKHEEVVEFYREYVSNSSANRRILQVQFSKDGSGNDSPPANIQQRQNLVNSNSSIVIDNKWTIISDINNWKFSMGLCPLKTQ